MKRLLKKPGKQARRGLKCERENRCRPPGTRVHSRLTRHSALGCVLGSHVPASAGLDLRRFVPPLQPEPSMCAHTEVRSRSKKQRIITAQLKLCPFKPEREATFSASCEAVPFQTALMRLVWI